MQDSPRSCPGHRSAAGRGRQAEARDRVATRPQELTFDQTPRRTLNTSGGRLSFCERDARSGARITQISTRCHLFHAQKPASTRGTRVALTLDRSIHRGCRRALLPASRKRSAGHRARPALDDFRRRARRRLPGCQPAGRRTGPFQIQNAARSIRPLSAADTRHGPCGLAVNLAEGRSTSPRRTAARRAA